MKKIFVIAQWEFFEKIKRKSFILSMIITPMILFGLVYLSSTFIETGNEAPSPIGILDITGNYHKTIAENLKKHNLQDGQPTFIIINLFHPTVPVENQLYNSEKMIIENDLNGFIFISYNAEHAISVQFYYGLFFNPVKQELIAESIEDAFLKVRLYEMGFSEDQLSNFLKNVNIEFKNIASDTISNDSDFIKIYLTSYFFILLMLVMILFSGGMFVRSIVEEKSNRIIEVLLSSCKINELLAGKIIGLSWLGLFQIAIWFILGGIIFNNNLLEIDFNGRFWLQIFYFILGYLLYTSIFVGFGSIVNTEHEAQQTTSILSTILIVPILIAGQVILNPNSILSNILSYFPLTTAPAMILRLNVIELSLLEILITITFSIISIYFVIMLSSILFKVGILSYGKMPPLRELFIRIKSRNN